jgi:hypothetical protein
MVGVDQVGFIRKLRANLGKDVELVLAGGQAVSGILIQARLSYVVVRTLTSPGYGGAEEVIIRSRDIQYVRIL